ncbi:lysosomal acid phosphatase [Chanos chanos]|uniref:Lysosomal acid phosphatase n=1 Tax=Chanos chanos TaxID=29144 RepID=A0A6J2UPF4_CHACN|nr:lysosomal acid phosphatase-like [Chanos chanos]
MVSLLTCLLLFVVSDTTFGKRELKLVTVLYRHGDRSPVKAYPKDPYQENAWPQGFGQLSQEGMRQHFELGKMLRERYKGFLSETYNRSEISVRSTDYDRTLMSAESNLAGLYPPHGSQVFDPSLKWQPIPVHTVPQEDERLLSFPLDGCPRYKALMNETEYTGIFLNMTETYKDFLEMVRNETGLENASIESIWSVHDTLFCESKHNMTLPKWVTSEVTKKLGILKNFGFQIMFGVYKREEKCRLQGGLLLDQILKNMSAVAKPDCQGPLKMIVYSAHDTTVVALQEALNVFNGLQPPYASCHIFELYKEENGSFSVAMFYRNDSTRDPYQLTLPGCELYCPLQDFITLTKSVIPVDWEKECQLDINVKDKEVIIGLAVCGSLLFVLVILLFTVLCRQRDPVHGYSHVINEADDHS